jgi:hypothetical protein
MVEFKISKVVIIEILYLQHFGVLDCVPLVLFGSEPFHHLASLTLPYALVPCSSDLLVRLPQFIHLVLPLPPRIPEYLLVVHCRSPGHYAYRLGNSPLVPPLLQDALQVLEVRDHDLLVEEVSRLQVLMRCKFLGM